MICLMATQLHELAVVAVLVVVVASFSCSILPVEAEQQLQPYIPFQNSKFQDDFFVEWSQSNVAAVDGGHTLQLSLNEASGEFCFLDDFIVHHLHYLQCFEDAFIDDVRLVEGPGPVRPTDVRLETPEGKPR